MRLRFLKAKTPEEVTRQADLLTARAIALGPPQWDGKQWVLWIMYGGTERMLEKTRGNRG